MNVIKFISNISIDKVCIESKQGFNQESSQLLLHLEIKMGIFLENTERASALSDDSGFERHWWHHYPATSRNCNDK